MKYTQDAPMAPPWLAFPSLHPYSIGWRMGAGETYIMALGSWLEGLSSQEREEYQKRFPAPKWWGSYWEGELEEENPATHFANGDHVIDYWEKEGVPAYSLPEITQEFRKGKKKNCIFFWGHTPSASGVIGKEVLSQWYPASFSYEQGDYFCAEQYMMAEKARLFGDTLILEQIMQGKNPKQVKEFGRKISNFSPTIWDKAKYSIVLMGNYHKFLQNVELRTYLLSTKNKILVETSPYDRVWGIGKSQQEPNLDNPLTWKGENLLGFALMEVREELKRICAYAPICNWDALKEEYHIEGIPT